VGGGVGGGGGGGGEGGVCPETESASKASKATRMPILMRRSGTRSQKWAGGRNTRSAHTRTEKGRLKSLCFFKAPLSFGFSLYTGGGGRQNKTEKATASSANPFLRTAHLAKGFGFGGWWLVV
jgi:hypothetical protein